MKLTFLYITCHGFRCEKINKTLQVMSNTLEMLTVKEKNLQHLVHLNKNQLTYIQFNMK